MAKKSIDIMESKAFPLNPKAKETLNLLTSYISKKTCCKCVDFISALRPEVQDEVANALWYFNIAIEHIPAELKHVKEMVWDMMMTIRKEKDN